MKRKVSIEELKIEEINDRVFTTLSGTPFTGIRKYMSILDNSLQEFEFQNGLAMGICKEYFPNTTLKRIGVINDDARCGYELEYYPTSEVRRFTVFDMENLIELIAVDEKGYRKEKFLISEQNDSLIKKWQKDREYYFEEGYYNNNFDIMPYYEEQNVLREKVICEDYLPAPVKYIAGVDVGYNELENKMIAGIVILDSVSLECIETATYESVINFPYIPGLFSFREVPPLLEAYKKLRTEPDLIICDGHGIAHPRGIGMASHLGIELDKPTIGCAKNRLIGAYDSIEKERSSIASLIFDSKEVGKVLRTQNNIKPVFISTGHKISLNTACEWILHLTPKFRLPETTRVANSLVNQILKERTDLYES